MARWLITGGAGFIGCNTAARLLADGHEVIVYDNLSRKGSEVNLAWLRSRGLTESVQADIRDAEAVRSAVENYGPDVVLHLAAQVAVTTSVANPREDFEVNAGGTLNVLEAVRLEAPNAVVLYASTNKVYGKIEGTDPVGETQPLDFRSPYGCSKGAADQYVRDYARIYGLNTVVFRQSCVYGGRQFGVEDQGWLAWFTIAALTGRPITIYGDGNQVRDLLHVDDMAEAYIRVAATDNWAYVRGTAFNIGGGQLNAITLREALWMIATRTGRPMEIRLAPARPGDQPYYVSNTDMAYGYLRWRPKVSVDDGFDRLHDWLSSNLDTIKAVAA